MLFVFLLLIVLLLFTIVCICIVLSSIPVTRHYYHMYRRFTAQNRRNRFVIAFPRVTYDNWLYRCASAIDIGQNRYSKST